VASDVTKQPPILLPQGGHPLFQNQSIRATLSASGSSSTRSKVIVAQLLSLVRNPDASRLGRSDDDMNPKDVMEEVVTRVARETGRPYATVENVWRIVSLAHEAGFILTDNEGLVVHLSPTDASLPAEILAEIEANYDDVLSLAEPLMHAMTMILRTLSPTRPN